MLGNLWRFTKAKVRKIVKTDRRPANVLEAQRRHVRLYPVCEACDSTTGGQAHHVKPYNKYKGLGDDPKNFITLCEKPSRMCHIWFGHGDKFQCFNPNVVQDARDHKAAFLRGDKKTCEEIKRRAKAARLPDKS